MTLDQLEPASLEYVLGLPEPHRSQSIAQIEARHEPPWTLTPAQLQARERGRKMPPPRLPALRAAIRAGWYVVTPAAALGVNPDPVGDGAAGVSSGSSANAEALQGLVTEASGFESPSSEGSQDTAIIEHT